MMTITKPEVIKLPNPPRGIKALPWRLPIWLYRLGLGKLLGNRFLLLTHKGNKSGQQRQAVLEVIQSYPSEERYLVVSGFGEKSHWYQNIKQEPRVTIQVGSKKNPAIANQLDSKLAGDVILEYTQNNPWALKTFSRLLGYEIEHSPQGYRQFGENIPVIQFSALKKEKLTPSE
jgi:deazaflavin-dependent oxidoreductase (nitroreductase family)